MNKFSKIFKSAAFANLSAMVSGQVFSNIFNFVAILIAARNLGVTNFGIFSTLLALSNIASKLMDFGFTPVLFRELSLNKTNHPLLSTALTLRGIGWFVILGVSLIAALALNLNTHELIIFLILQLNIIISAKYINVRELLEVLFRTDFKMRYPMIFNNIDNLILIILILCISYFGWSVFTFTVVYTASNIPGFILMIHFLKREYQYKFTISLQHAKWLFMESWSVFVYVILASFFQQFDLIFLTTIKGAYITGLYSVSSRLSTPIVIVLSSIITALLPIFIKQKGEELHNIQKQNLLTLFNITFLLISIVCLLFSFRAPFFISLIFGPEFVSAEIAVIIVMWSQIFFMHAFLLINLCVMYNTQKMVFWYSLALVVGNLLLNLLVTPTFSLVGAAVAKLLASLIGVIVLSRPMREIGLPYFPYRLRTIIWLCAMVILLFSIRQLNDFVFFAISLTFMASSLFIFKVVDLHDIKLLLHADKSV